MNTKRLTVRFNLQNKEEHQAWEFLHSRDGSSLSKEVICILNAAQQYEDLQVLIRRTITEAMQGIVVPNEPVSDEIKDEETDATVLDFLDSFSWRPMRRHFLRPNLEVTPLLASLSTEERKRLNQNGTSEGESFQKAVSTSIRRCGVRLTV